MPERLSWRILGYRAVSRVVWHGLDLPIAIYFRLFPRPSSCSTLSCVLLHSFDGYKRFWPAALHFSRLALPQKLPLICASERIPWASDVICLLTGPGSFIWRLARAMHRLRRSYAYVLYLQEDMWLTRPVSETDLVAWLSLMQRRGLHLLKLSAETIPPDVPPQLAIQSPLDHVGSHPVTLYGSHDFVMSHHGSLFHIDFLLKTLVFAWLMGARQPKQHEIYVSRALRDLTASPQHPRRPVRIAAWQHQPLIEVVHASDGGELTPGAFALLKTDPLAPCVDETLPGEVFPARQPPYRSRHVLG